MTERCLLRTPDGVNLAAWYSPANGPSRAGVVLAHGFVGGGAAAHVLEHVLALGDAGVDVLTYDARGHGASGGRCTLGAHEQYDVAAAVDALVDRTGSRAHNLPVVLIGESMGATGVLTYAANHPERVAGVVTVGATAEWTMKLNLTTLASALLTRTRLGRRVLATRMDVDMHPEWLDPEEPKSSAARLPVPLAVIHGGGDRFIPQREAYLIHHRAGGPRRLRIVPGMGHGLSAESVSHVRDAVDWALRHAPVPL